MSKLVEASTLTDPGNSAQHVGETVGATSPLAPPQGLGEAAVVDWLRALSRSRSVGTAAAVGREPLRPDRDLERLSGAVEHTAMSSESSEWALLPVGGTTVDVPEPLLTERSGPVDFALAAFEELPADSVFALPELPPDQPKLDLGLFSVPDLGASSTPLPNFSSDISAEFLLPAISADSGLTNSLGQSPTTTISVLAAPPGVDVLAGDLTPSVTALLREHLGASVGASVGASARAHVPSTEAVEPTTIPQVAPSVVASAAPPALNLEGLQPLTLQPLVPTTALRTQTPPPAEEPTVTPTVTALPGSGAVIVAARNLSKRHAIGSQWIDVLTDVTLDLRAGEFVVLTGMSGSGKTTLLSCLAGIESFDRGELLFEGHALSDLTESDRARHRAAAMGIVFQSFHLVSILTAVENVELPLLVAGWSPNDAREEAEAALNLVGLSRRGQHLPDQLSGGEQQRVAIARALVGEPRIVFADEPTGNLDESSAKKIAHLFHELHADGLTLVIATHDERLLALATTVVEVNDGRANARRGPRTIV